MEPQLSTPKAQNEYFLDPTAPKNMSQLKLMNNSLEDFDRQEAVITHSQSSSAVICIHEEAHGFNLQDAKLLSNDRIPNLYAVYAPFKAARGLICFRNF